ncbi:DUF4124 domain-containing protein [Polaromonas sp.]|uniref:DUF4124 domain-containing protein n=1 Tax=Polaromonas sp. TaxID=1869339 RepID=UPI0013B86735|nr:DUF4124 domain-containing protein [Polaromonas sp.]NDP64902.1 glutaredoxin family protein [Polaromonas sp.]
MKSSAFCFSASRALLALVLASGAVTALQAQQVYRIVGPDGKVTFSDRLPSVQVNGTKVSEDNADTPGGTAVAAGLPFELRQVALKYPVVLYTGDNCAPCGAGRSLLTSRGVPFSEKTVRTAADAEALQRLSGEASLPFLTIGSQQLKGFSDAEWTQFLNAAGYPKSSILPASYRPAAAAPLVTVAPTPAAAEGREVNTVRKLPAARPVQPPANSSNPSGIKF